MTREQLLAQMREKLLALAAGKFDAYTRECIATFPAKIDLDDLPENRVRIVDEFFDRLMTFMIDVSNAGNVDRDEASERFDPVPRGPRGPRR